MQNQIPLMLNALEQIAPTYKWEHIGTGGGCTAIYGELKNAPKPYTRTILITDGHAEAPQNFGEDATAIYYECEEQVEYRFGKAWTDVQPFFNLLTELAEDIQQWDNEPTPLDKLINNLTEWAEEIGKNKLALMPYVQQAFAEDLRTAIELLETHARG